MSLRPETHSPRRFYPAFYSVILQSSSQDSDTNVFLVVKLIEPKFIFKPSHLTEICMFPAWENPEVLRHTGITES